MTLAPFARASSISVRTQSAGALMLGTCPFVIVSHRGPITTSIT
jgi:hypothetical protein